MQQTVPGILSRIAEHKRAEMAARVWDRGALEQEAESRRAERRGFRKALEAKALAAPNVARLLDGAAPKKIIVVPDRLVNLVA